MIGGVVNQPFKFLMSSFDQVWFWCSLTFQNIWFINYGYSRIDHKDPIDNFYLWHHVSPLLFLEMVKYIQGFTRYFFFKFENNAAHWYEEYLNNFLKQSINQPVFQIAICTVFSTTHALNPFVRSGYMTIVWGIKLRIKNKAHLLFFRRWNMIGSWS